MPSSRISLPVLIGIGLVVALAVTRAGEIRARAEAGLGEGMPPREAALARGFVLGDDDELDQGTKEDFIRAGLSHLTRWCLLGKNALFPRQISSWEPLRDLLHGAPSLRVV
jgi:hypothetical protein